MALETKAWEGVEKTGKNPRPPEKAVEDADADMDAEANVSIPAAEVTAVSWLEAEEEVEAA